MTALAPAMSPTFAVDAAALAPTPLLPVGHSVPASRWTHPSVRMRELLRTEPYLFGPGVYDPFGAQLVMHHGFKAVYFSGYSFAIGHLGTLDRLFEVPVTTRNWNTMTTIARVLGEGGPRWPKKRRQPAVHRAAAAPERGAD